MVETIRGGVMENKHGKKYLTESGFDGLYCSGECACDLSDLYPCDNGPYFECRPGYKTPCDCGEHDWHISGERKR